MRIWMAVIGAALIAGACTNDTTGLDDTAAQLDEMADYAYGATRVGDRGSNPFLERLAQLPAELALSADQRSQIDALVAQFVAASTADRAALAALLEQAAAARQAGQTREQVAAILAGGTAIRERLHQAERELHSAVTAVLTPAQRAWLTGRTSTPREPGPCSTVTDAQRTEISALRAAFEQANAADIALVTSAHERARAAVSAGATREQIAAILTEARAALQRLATARAALQDAIQGVLTPAQLAAGCLGSGGTTRTRP